MVKLFLTKRNHNSSMYLNWKLERNNASYFVDKTLFEDNACFLGFTTNKM